MNEKTLYNQIVTWRRDLHQMPELEMDLPKTAAYVKKQLENTAFELIELPEECGSGFAAFLDRGKDQTIAFRTDMDALPVTEKTGLPFASKTPGCMHACGHDGHMANMLAAAYRISEEKNSLNANVLLLFQAGEETPGGAKPIVQSGLLEEKNVKALFGMHLWPMLPEGVVGVRSVEMMARCAEIRMTFHGQSAHAAKYWLGHDAMIAACDFIKDCYAFEQVMDPSIYRLLRFGIFKSGRAGNAVADQSYVQGTMRAFDDEIFESMAAKVEECAKKACEETGCTYDLIFDNGYPAVLNDPKLTEWFTSLDESIVLLETPEMISEDFAFYQKAVPAVFFFLGTGSGIPLHANNFDFNEKVLLKSSSLLCKAAQAWNR